MQKNGLSNLEEILDWSESNLLIKAQGNNSLEKFNMAGPTYDKKKNPLLFFFFIFLFCNTTL